jgi:phosphatidylserine/phosphatidylglycerophosphate/cardiolipin synthase-like enzyme
MAPSTCLPMMITSRRSDADPTSNRTDNTQDQGFLAAWGAATSHIHVQTPNLNDDAAKAALLTAVKRGVRVDVILSKGFNEESEALPGQGGGNEMNVRMLYDDLAAAGIADACDRLRIRWYSRDGVRPVLDNSFYASHAKFTSIDSAVAIVGTANMDTQSWNNSREVNVVVDSADTASAWDAQLFVEEFAHAVTVDRCR